MTISRWAAGTAAAAIFAGGAAAAYLLRGPGGEQPHGSPAAPAVAAMPAPPGGAMVRIPPDLVARAGITVQPASTTAVAAVVRVPGTVQPNAYRQVSVTPLAGGRVTRVLVELGQTVVRGTPIADVYSPDVAQARAAYLSASADVDAGDARVRRTERLATLGSASQQELEQVRAEQVGRETQRREAAARLTLFGIDASRLADAHADPGASTVRVVAPQAGVIIQRPASAGMTAEPSTVLATIADLSPVWIMADVYERDFAAITTGAAATVTAVAYPGLAWHGRVAYISPDVRPETRTTQVRIEVPNQDGKLRFGMFVDVAIGMRETAGVSVPASAIQTIGADTVVFVPDGTSPGAFRERRVEAGASQGDRVIVLAGLAAGEPLVTTGSFELRAEAERQGVRPVTTQAASVAVTASGFEPASLTLQRGVPARLTFTRTTDHTCATELDIPAYGIHRALPLNQPVTIEFVPAASGATFQCGMGMLTGTLVVR